MKSERIFLKNEYGFLQNGTLDCLTIDYPWDGENTIGWKRPALIVVPGGGYGMVSKREGETVATAFLARGFQTFILTYTVAPNGRYPDQLFELAAAVDYVKKHAEEYGVNKDEVFVVGFSAGGHLTGNLAVEYASVSSRVGQTLDCKPTAVGLSYPVISQIHGHQGSYDNLLAGYSEEEKTEFLKTLNLDQAVTKDTPPAFVWATAEDGAVPADNALRYVMALDKNSIPYELHVYPKGPHGISTANCENNAPHVGLQKAKKWVDECAEFFHMYVTEKF